MIIDKIKHSMKCGITLDNTKLLEDNYIGLGYQIIECIECGKKYILFRQENGNIHQSLFNPKMENYIAKLNLDLVYINKQLELISKKYIVHQNINEYIEYPLGDINIEISLQSKDTGIFIYSKICKFKNLRDELDFILHN